MPRDIEDVIAAGEVYQRCFEDSTDGIVITDVQGRIVRANRAWLERHGYTLAEVVGRSTRIVASPTSTRELYEHMWKQIGDPSVGSWKGEIINRHKDGSDIPLLLTITPIRSAGEIAGYMGISIDITERKQFEEFKRQYDLIVWHDLRSPLNAVLSMFELFLGGYLGEVAGRQRELLGKAQQQARRMLDIIATSLDVEKLKRSQLRLELEEVDLFAAASASLETLRPLASARNIRLQLLAGEREAAAGDHLVRSLDPVHFERCTDNLVKNAIEASPRGGLVRVSVAESDGRAKLTVSNGGAPIPPDVRSTLFHPFGTWGKRGGTGLGLYGVKLLVEAMGGSVSAQSDERGTSFELAFPA